MKRWMIILLLGAFLTPAQAITKEALADSLTRYIGFVSAVPPVKITKMKVKGSSITIYTNKTLSGAALTNEDLYRLRLQVSRWVFRNNNGKVTIYSDNKELKDLVVSPYSAQRNGKDRPDRPTYRAVGQSRYLLQPRRGSMEVATCGAMDDG